MLGEMRGMLEEFEEAYFGHETTQTACLREL
jgi:hypothetical protein